MAYASTELSDITIITSDNPRTEDPLKIIDDIVKGVKQGSKYYVEADREKAIPLFALPHRLAGRDAL